MGLPLHWAMVILVGTLAVFFIGMTYWDRTGGKLYDYCSLRWEERRRRKAAAAECALRANPGTDSLLPPAGGIRMQRDRTGTHEVELVEDVADVGAQTPAATDGPRFWQFWRWCRRSNASEAPGESVNMQDMLPQPPARCVPAQRSRALHVGRGR